MKEKLIEDLEDVRVAMSNGNHGYAFLKVQKIIMELKHARKVASVSVHFNVSEDAATTRTAG